MYNIASSQFQNCQKDDDHHQNELLLRFYLEGEFI